MGGGRRPAGGGWARALAGDLLDALTDRRCPGCEGPLERTELVCAACDAAIDRSGSVLCLACLRGDPADAVPAAGARGCPRHGSRTLLLAGPPHAAPLDAVVRHFKYAGASRLGRWLASLVPEPPGVSERFGREAVIVPVPLHVARRAARGFDQAALLAEHVGAWWGVPVVHALRRVRDTAPQARGGADERRRNVRGAFALAADKREVVRGRTVLLIDDVATTGSTLLEAHEALATAHPAWVLALAAAHGGGPEGPQLTSNDDVAGVPGVVLESQAWQIGTKPSSVHPYRSISEPLATDRRDRGEGHGQAASA